MVAAGFDVAVRSGRSCSARRPGTSGTAAVPTRPAPGWGSDAVDRRRRVHQNRRGRRCATECRRVLAHAVSLTPCHPPPSNLAPASRSHSIDPGGPCAVTVARSQRRIRTGGAETMDRALVRAAELGEVAWMRAAFGYAGPQVRDSLGLAARNLGSGVVTVCAKGPGGMFFSRCIGLGIDAPVPPATSLRLRRSAGRTADRGWCSRSPRPPSRPVGPICCPQPARSRAATG